MSEHLKRYHEKIRVLFKKKKKKKKKKKGRKKSGTSTFDVFAASRQL